jgi:hypothetical protein
MIGYPFYKKLQSVLISQKQFDDKNIKVYFLGGLNMMVSFLRECSMFPLRVDL